MIPCMSQCVCNNVSPWTCFWWSDVKDTFLISTNVQLNQRQMNSKIAEYWTCLSPFSFVSTCQKVENPSIDMHALRIEMAMQLECKSTVNVLDSGLLSCPWNIHILRVLLGFRMFVSGVPEKTLVEMTSTGHQSVTRHSFVPAWENNWSSIILFQAGCWTLNFRDRLCSPDLLQM